MTRYLAKRFRNKQLQRLTKVALDIPTDKGVNLCITTTQKYEMKFFFCLPKNPLKRFPTKTIWEQVKCIEKNVSIYEKRGKLNRNMQIAI